MKKYIAAVMLAGGILGLHAQTEAQTELQGKIDEGIVKFTSPNGKYSFRVGARIDVDG